MDIQLYAIHVVPVILIVYFAVVLFMHPPKEVMLASLAGGLVMAILNALGDLLAYYASWWHYSASGLALHLPLPFYLTQLFIFGGLAFVLIWRFSEGREQAGLVPNHRLSLALIIGVPLLGYTRDILDAVVLNSSYLVWDSVLAYAIDLVLWVAMFYAGYFVFRKVLAPGQRIQVESSDPS